MHNVNDSECREVKKLTGYNSFSSYILKDNLTEPGLEAKTVVGNQQPNELLSAQYCALQVVNPIFCGLGATVKERHTEIQSNWDQIAY